MEPQVSFLYPPHADSRMKIRPESVERLEKEGGWIAQRKYNGTNVVVHILNGLVEIYNRHSQKLTTYVTTLAMTQVLLKLDIPRDCEVVLNGELLHTKAKLKTTGQQAQTDTIVFFDLLYFRGFLLTEPFEDRYNILKCICRNPTELESGRRDLLVADVDGSQLWLAQNFTDDFNYRFYEFYEFDNGLDLHPEIEGLVCKKLGKASKIKIGNVPYDVDWMMRVRKTKERIYLF